LPNVHDIHCPVVSEVKKSHAHAVVNVTVLPQEKEQLVQATSESSAKSQNSASSTAGHMCINTRQGSSWTPLRRNDADLQANSLHRAGATAEFCFRVKT